MQKTKRVLIQAATWFLIWMVLWLLQRGNLLFIKDNIAAFFVQVTSIVLLVWWLAPHFLLKKKYFVFTIISLVLLFVGAYISSNIMTPVHEPFMPPNRPPPGLHRGPKGAIAPTQYVIHLLIIGVSFMLAVLLETFVFVKAREEERVRFKSENLQTELKLLKSQINPHFLFNSLNNIYALSVLDSDKTQRSISYLSDMLRYVLYECDRPRVPLSKEITYIENYIRLFSLKSSKPYPIKTDFTILDASVQVAPMLFIPFMENALKHSNIEKIKGTFIHLSIQSDTQEIHFEIENSTPKTAQNKDSVGGIGIENVKRRLSILYPQMHQLQIDENGDTFKVQLNLVLDADN